MALWHGVPGRAFPELGRRGTGKFNGGVKNEGMVAGVAAAGSRRRSFQPLALAVYSNIPRQALSFPVGAGPLRASTTTIALPSLSMASTVPFSVEGQKIHSPRRLKA